MMIFGIPTLLIAVGAVLLASTAIGTIALHTELHTGLVVLTILQGIIFAGAVFHVWQWRDKGHLWSRRTLLFILGVAVLLRALPLFSLPHSTDIYRYIWDGRVQADGINPYAISPPIPLSSICATRRSMRR